MDEADIAYRCEAGWFCPYRHDRVRWLDIHDDFEILQNFHNARQHEVRYTVADAIKWKESGFRDAGLVENGMLVARAALWTHSEDEWELAGVFTIPEARGRGLARSVCTFVTTAILEAGRVATCHTQPSNQAMRRVVETLGYRRT